LKASDINELLRFTKVENALSPNKRPPVDFKSLSSFKKTISNQSRRTLLHAPARSLYCVCAWHKNYSFIHSYRYISFLADALVFLTHLFNRIFAALFTDKNMDASMIFFQSWTNKGLETEVWGFVLRSRRQVVKIMHK